MSNKVFASGASAAIALGFCLASGMALAQEPTNVTIEAQRSQVIGRNSLGGPIKLISITRHVNYADLDLATFAGSATLKQRVSDAATEVCGQLKKMHPFAVRDQVDFIPTCVNQATTDAMLQVQAAISAAADRKAAETEPAG